MLEKRAYYLGRISSPALLLKRTANEISVSTVETHFLFGVLCSPPHLQYKCWMYSIVGWTMYKTFLFWPFSCILLCYLYLKIKTTKNFSGGEMKFLQNFGPAKISRYTVCDTIVLCPPHTSSWQRWSCADLLGLFPKVLKPVRSFIVMYRFSYGSKILPLNNSWASMVQKRAPH